MQVRVLFFGMLKDLVGRSDELVELPEGATVAVLIARFEREFPRLKQYTPSLAFAINQEYASPDVPLRDRDEVGLLPPVSGGSGKRDPENPFGPARHAAGSKPPGRISGDTTVIAGSQPRLAANVSIVEHAIDAQAILADIKQPEDGAVAVFEGIVRDHSRGRRTLYLEYEAYQPMALSQMEALAEEALSRFAVREVSLVHRLGRLEIGETSVFIAVASAHRAAAFDACRWLIDTLKKSVPIWKKEFFEDGAVWADGEPFPEEIRRPSDPDDSPAASK